MIQELLEINRRNKVAWKKEMIKHRWKNFLTIWIYIFVCVFFLALGYFVKFSFFNIVYWYIWMILSSIFLILGVYTMFSYLWLIIKYRK